MKIERASTEAFECPKLTSCQLPTRIVDRAANGLGWVSLISAVTSIALTIIEHVLQPEFAQAWAHPVLRIASLSVVLLSAAFIVVQRSGWVSKRRLLDLGMVFQVAIAFAGGLFEGAAYRNPNAVVVGISGIAVWMMLCARLMPNAPLKCAATAGLCTLMWPAGYWVDLQVFGYEPMPLSRMLVWILPLGIISIWMYFLNKRTLTFYMQQQCAEDVGSYVLTKLIGRGGMGEVWRAKHKTLARDAAVKLIRSEVLQASTGQQEMLLKRRFEREAQVTASLRSPHTVALYDFGEAKCGSFYYVMELIDGIDLESLVERFGPMDPARVVHILRQVSKSLEEAHRLGLVHRDIKPRNILLGKLGLEYDYAKVLDFGLVKTLRRDDPERTATTMDGVTSGTPAYLSPEAALGNRTIDGRTDLYSLGCTAYFLLTGCTVFEAASPTAYAIAHVQTPPPPIRERTDLPVPAELEAIVMKLLEKDPANRIQNAFQLERLLRNLTEIREWSSEQAEQWWETNLPEMSLPPDSAEQSSVSMETRAAYA
jgi:serine/threonine-protein kinase